MDDYLLVYHFSPEARDHQHPSKTSMTSVIVKSLPHPPVRKIADGAHAYVTLTDVIATMFASGTDVDFELAFYTEGIYSPAFDDDSGANPATISTSRVALSLIIELKKDETGEFAVYHWIKW